MLSAWPGRKGKWKEKKEDLRVLVDGVVHVPGPRKRKKGRKRGRRGKARFLHFPKEGKMLKKRG